LKQTNENMKNEMNDIPTPETNAFMIEHGRAVAAQKTRPSTWDILQSLERRLTIAREALQASVDAGGSFCDLISAQRKAEESLALTAPKP
jgi:hypothetical protein